jgi:DAHP synthetase I family
VGWQGLVNDPDLHKCRYINKGLRTTRQLFVDQADRGMPIGSERLDTITPQVLSNCLSLGVLSATRQQGNREIAGVTLTSAFNPDPKLAKPEPEADSIVKESLSHKRRLSSYRCDKPNQWRFAARNP